MSDLVERLRALKPGPCTISARDDDDPPVRLPVNRDGPEAADEIERLTALLEQAEAALEELLSAHHNLYRTHWGDCSDSTNDIAAKRAHALLAKLHNQGEAGGAE